MYSLFHNSNVRPIIPVFLFFSWMLDLWHLYTITTLNEPSFLSTNWGIFFCQYWKNWVNYCPCISDDIPFQKEVYDPVCEKLTKICKHLMKSKLTLWRSCWKIISPFYGIIAESGMSVQVKLWIILVKMAISIWPRPITIVHNFPAYIMLNS